VNKVHSGFADDAVVGNDTPARTYRCGGSTGMERRELMAALFTCFPFHPFSWNRCQGT
jgi:hypothetical protein